MEVMSDPEMDRFWTPKLKKMDFIWTQALQEIKEMWEQELRKIEKLWKMETHETEELRTVGTNDIEELRMVETHEIGELRTVWTYEIENLRTVETHEIEELRTVGTYEMDILWTQQLKEMDKMWIENVRRIKEMWRQQLNEIREMRTQQLKKADQDARRKANGTSKTILTSMLLNPMRFDTCRPTYSHGYFQLTLTSDPTVESFHNVHLDAKTRLIEDQHKQQEKIMFDSRKNEDDAGSKNITGEKQMTYASFLNRQLHSHKKARWNKIIVAMYLCSLCLPFAEGTSIDHGQQAKQAVSEIYQETLVNVSHCPNVSNYMERASEKCDVVCNKYLQYGRCSYHCMRDSYKTSLVEFCAKPKLLFEYCPEYDPIGRTIQKDIYTLCNPLESSEKIYNSSDLFFCDPVNCLQLRDSAVSTGLTTLKSYTTPVSGDPHDTSESWYLLIIAFLLVGTMILLEYKLVFRKRAKKGNPDDVQNNNEQAVLYNAV